MSQTPGSTFYDHSSLTKQLETFASNNRLQKIISALGDDADLHLVGGLLRNVAQGVTPSAVSYTHLTLPTTPYV